MRTSRGRKIVLILSAIFAIILGVITTMTWESYNICALIISAYLYFGIFVFIIIDAYYWIKNKKDFYHLYSLIRDLLILVTVILFLIGILNIPKLNSIIFVTSAIVLIFPIYRVSEIADKHYLNNMYD